MPGERDDEGNVVESADDCLQFLARAVSSVNDFQDVSRPGVELVGRECRQETAAVEHPSEDDLYLVRGSLRDELLVGQ